MRHRYCGTCLGTERVRFRLAYGRLNYAGAIAAGTTCRMVAVMEPPIALRHSGQGGSSPRGTRCPLALCSRSSGSPEPQEARWYQTPPTLGNCRVPPLTAVLDRPRNGVPRASILPGCARLRSRLSSGAFWSLSSNSPPQHTDCRHRDACLAGMEEIQDEFDVSVDGLPKQGRQITGSGSVAIVDIPSGQVDARANRSSVTGPLRTSSPEWFTTRCTSQGRSPDSRPRCTRRGWRARESGPA